MFSAIGALLLIAFVVREKRYGAPLVRLSTFRTRSLSVANLTIFLVAGGMFSMFLFVSLYPQNVLSYTPLRAGVAFLPAVAGIGVGAGMAQQAIKRIDIRAVTLARLTIAAWVSHAYSYHHHRQLSRGYHACTRGDGNRDGADVCPGHSDRYNDSLQRRRGFGFWASQYLATSGGSLGLAILFTVAINHTTDILANLHRAPGVADISERFVQGYRLAFLSGMVLLLLGAAIVAVFPGKSDIADIATGEQPDSDSLVSDRRRRIDELEA